MFMHPVAADSSCVPHGAGSDGRHQNSLTVPETMPSGSIYLSSCDLMILMTMPLPGLRVIATGLWSLKHGFSHTAMRDQIHGMTRQQCLKTIMACRDVIEGDVPPSLRHADDPSTHPR
jgi:hypothetical protein